MSPATTKIAKHAQSTWNDWRRKNFIELCIDTETAWSVNDPPTSRLALQAWQIRRRRPWPTSTGFPPASFTAICGGLSATCNSPLEGEPP